MARNALRKHEGYMTWLRFLVDEIPKNLKSALTVSLVNIPLSISLALAGGALPVPGIVTAFWCGATSALLGGSEYNIVGPTGALSGILAAAASIHHPRILPWLSIISGFLILIIKGFNLMDYLLFIPESVVQGFTLGVAIIIGLGQLDFAIGLETHHDSHLAFYEKILESFSRIGDIQSVYPVLFFLVNVVALFNLLRKFPTFPWAVVLCIIGAVVGATGSTYEVPIAKDLITLGQHFSGVDLTFTLVLFPTWSSDVLSLSVFSSSCAISFIAILETLISARIADDLTHTDHDKNAEIFGLGVANIIGGAFGGIPATAALARTTLNIHSGATSRLSALLNTLILAGLCYFILPLFTFVPVSSIAAILAMVSYRMVNFTHFAHMWTYQKPSFFISLLTALLCIFVDTMFGLIVGALISLLIYANSLSKGHAEIIILSTNVPAAGPSDSILTQASAAVAELVLGQAGFVAEVDIAALDRVELRSALSRRFEQFRSFEEASAHHSCYGLGEAGIGLSMGERSSLLSRSTDSIGFASSDKGINESKETAHQMYVSLPEGEAVDDDEQGQRGAVWPPSDENLLPLVQGSGAAARRASLTGGGGGGSANAGGTPTAIDGTDSAGISLSYQQQQPQQQASTEASHSYVPNFHYFEQRAQLPNKEQLARPQTGVRVLFYSVAGQLSYINAAAHVMRVKKILPRLRFHDVNVFVVSLRTVWALDLDGIDTLATIEALCKAAGVVCVLEGAKKNVAWESLLQHEFVDMMNAQGRFISDE